MKYLKKIFWIVKEKFRKNKVNLNVFIKGYENIYLGHNCKLLRYSELDASSNGNITLENNVTINPYVLIQANHNGNIRIKEGTEINNFTIINSGGKITIGKNVLIGPKVNIISYSHNFGNLNILISNQGSTTKEITIEDNVWIGANCTILPGVTIKNGAIIGANSVVTKNILPNSINVGVPCKKIKGR